jgi:hypothetical protein
MTFIGMALLLDCWRVARVASPLSSDSVCREEHRRLTALLLNADVDDEDGKSGLSGVEQAEEDRRDAAQHRTPQ